MDARAISRVSYDGLFDQRRRKPSILRVPMEQAERVLALYRETYFDLTVSTFTTTLTNEITSHLLC